MIISGSLLTTKQNIFSFGKSYTLITIYIIIIYFILNLNLNNFRLFNLDNSFFSSVFIYDFYSTRFLNLLIISSLIYLLIVYSYINNKYLFINFEYPIVLLISIIGLIFLLITHDLFIWFLAIELQSFCFYSLAGYRTNRSFSQTEAAIKYFIYGSLASSLYLFGVSLIYSLLGTVNLDTVSSLGYFPMPSLYYIALVFIFISLSFKLAIAPFHFWVPSVYTLSNSIITFLFIFLPKIPLYYLLSILPAINNIVCFITLSLLIGVIAFLMTNFKTFIAYSAIANNAFLLTCLMFESIFSVSALIFYIFSYNIIITILFTPSLFLRKYDQTIALSNLRDLIILKKTNITIACLICGALLSTTGIPPFIGFYAKLLILISAASSAAYFIIFCLLIFSVISCFYYIRLIKILFFSFSLKYAGLNNYPILSAYILTGFSLINSFFILCPSYTLLLL
jgi:NADH-quinone oxidoreductase subunit N